MAYKPTGRPPGRPRSPVTANGTLTRARKAIPHVGVFPHLRRAVDRAMMDPASTVLRLDTGNVRNVRVDHRYTPAERGQILAFVWWVYCNRTTWSRTRRAAAVTSISPLMMFSSHFLSAMTDLSVDTVKRHMIKSPKMEISRVTGSCEMWVIHSLLESAADSMDAFRETVCALAEEKVIPNAFLSRMSGVPVGILKRPLTGIQFFPEVFDWHSGRFGTVEQYNEYKNIRKAKDYDPDPGGQYAVRDAFGGETMGPIHKTSSPVSDEGCVPHYLAIPGLPSISNARELGLEYFRRVREWERLYELSAAKYLGLVEAS